EQRRRPSPLPGRHAAGAGAADTCTTRTLARSSRGPGGEPRALPRDALPLRRGKGALRLRPAPRGQGRVGASARKVSGGAGICERLGEGLYRPHIERAGGSRPALTREVRSGSTNGGLMSCGTWASADKPPQHGHALPPGGHTPPFFHALTTPRLRHVA